MPSLPLIDPMRGRRPRRIRRVEGQGVPRILFFVDEAPPRLPPPPSRDDPVDATRLRLRLAALAAALDDLPGQALRLARWTALRRRAREAGRASPLKPGRAPALPKTFCRRRPAHEVHDLLRELHGLARWAMELDTS